MLSIDIKFFSFLEKLWSLLEVCVMQYATFSEVWCLGSLGVMLESLSFYLMFIFYFFILPFVNSPFKP